MEINGNEMVSYNSSTGSFKVGDTTDGDSGFYWHDLHYPYYNYYYPNYSICEKSKVEQAFKIVNKLMENKIIDKITLKKFIKLVNDIAEVV